MDHYNSRKIIAERIKALRIETNLQQRELAVYLGVSPANISKYERGEIELRYDTLIKLSEYFNVSIDYLFGLKNDKSIITNYGEYYDFIEIIIKSIPDGLTPKTLKMLINVWKNSKK
ncbi:MAG: helix-turn-helix transcriptional regulator [Clostridiales bacterium]